MTRFLKFSLAKMLSNKKAYKASVVRTQNVTTIKSDSQEKVVRAQLFEIFIYTFVKKVLILEAIITIFIDLENYHQVISN